MINDDGFRYYRIAGSGVALSALAEGHQTTLGPYHRAWH